MSTKSLAGKKFGRWTILVELPRVAGRKKALAMCSCGTKVAVFTGNLIYGKSKSCGCLTKETCGNQSRTHGLSKHPLFSTWYDMIQRCHNTEHPSYKYYGGRGIVVDQKWRESFATFVADIKDKPSRDYSLDRIDNSKGYSKDNLRWATKATQSRNTSANVMINIMGHNACLTDWAATFATKPGLVTRRRKKYGISWVRALTATKNAKMCINGALKSRSEWLEYYGATIAIFKRAQSVEPDIKKAFLLAHKWTAERYPNR